MYDLFSNAPARRVFSKSPVYSSPEKERSSLAKCRELLLLTESRTDPPKKKKYISFFEYIPFDSIESNQVLSKYIGYAEDSRINKIAPPLRNFRGTEYKQS